MTRREIITLFSAAMVISIWPQTIRAQKANAHFKVGYLGNSQLDTPEAVSGWEAFRTELQGRGWVENQNVIFVFRYAEGVAERHSQNAKDLLDGGVDLIVAVTGTAALAAKKLTTTVPVIFANVPNPMEMGLVSSIARPGGNLTGLTTLGLDMAGKRLQILKEAFPISRAGYLITGRQETFDRSVYAAAEKLELHLVPVKASHAEDIRPAMTTMTDVEAWFINEEALYFTERRTIIDVVSGQRKPAMYPSTYFVDAGGLMSYSVGQPGQYRRLAALADKILRGAKPADLPIEQPSEFELVINLRTARDLGILLPETLTVRADRLVD